MTASFKTNLFTNKPAMTQMNTKPGPPNPTPTTGSSRLEALQMQLMLLEEQNRRRLHEARQEQELEAGGGAPHRAPTPPSAALQHYQMHLMHLDQENKRRLAKIREGQDAPHTAPARPADYEMQLRMQDERRLRKAEQDAEMSKAGGPATGQAFYGDRPDVE